MSRLRDELFAAKIELATQKIALDSLERERDSFRSRAELAEVRLSDGAEEKVKVLEAHQRELAALLTETNELRVQKAVLLERLDLLANHLPPAPTQAFNSMSEEREDADYAFHSGLIDRDEYEALLASAGALNTEISFDADLTRL